MAFPIVLGVATDSSGGTGSTASRVHAIPASEAGNLLMMQFGGERHDLVISDLPAGWVQFHHNGHADNTLSTHIWIYKQADGSESTSLSFTVSHSGTRVASICYRIAGHEDPSVQAPQVSAVATNPSGQSTTSGSPPSLSPTGGEKDYLWFATICFNTNTTGAVTGPSNYTDLQNIAAAQQGSSNGPRICSARRERTASSENPGNFTWESSTRWQAVTIAVHPAPAPPPTATLSGTVTEDINEGDIRNGGRTIILTLSNGSWVAAGAAFDAERQNIIDGITALAFQTNGWNDVVQPAIAVGDVVRTSDTVVTITLPAVPSYNPFSDESVRAVIPFTAVGAGWNEAVQPAIPLDNVVRTSDNVVTISLPDVPGYAIADPEDITATVPASAFNADDGSNDPVVADPSFTISDLPDDNILADPFFTIAALARAVRGPLPMQQMLALRMR
jgi:hypothetical protein